MRGMKTDSASAVQLRRDLIARGLRLPFVENAAPMITVPFRSTYSDDAVGVGSDSAHHVTDVITQIASPSYFATMGTRLLRGRNIRRRRSCRRRARRHRERNVGARRVSEAGSYRSVHQDVGRHDAVPHGRRHRRRRKVERLRGTGWTDALLPARQPPSEKDATLTFRVRGDAAVQAEALRRDLQRAMPGASYVTTMPFTEIVVPTMRSWRLGATMFAVFGGLALLLAGIGLYSVIAYSVAQRTHEMGVRVALGARAGDVVAMIVRDAIAVAGAGLVLGILAALASARWVGPMLFEISPRDPFVYATVAVVLLAVAVAASWIPAARAARVDPSVALRAN